MSLQTYTNHAMMTVLRKRESLHSKQQSSLDDIADIKKNLTLFKSVLEQRPKAKDEDDTLGTKITNVSITP